MKLKLADGKTKQIDYFGIPLMVPEKAEYVATDSDGEVFWYSGSKPFSDRFCEGWDIGCSHTMESLSHYIDMEGVDWKETLMDIRPPAPAQTIGAEGRLPKPVVILDTYGDDE